MTNPVLLACLFALLGATLCVAGVYVLAGVGWALLSGAPFFFLLAAILLRGVKHE